MALYTILTTVSTAVESDPALLKAELRGRKAARLVVVLEQEQKLFYIDGGHSRQQTLWRSPVYFTPKGAAPGFGY